MALKNIQTQITSKLQNTNYNYNFKIQNNNLILTIFNNTKSDKIFYILNDINLLFSFNTITDQENLLQIQISI